MADERVKPETPATPRPRGRRTLEQSAHERHAEAVAQPAAKLQPDENVIAPGRPRTRGSAKDATAPTDRAPDITSSEPQPMASGPAPLTGQDKTTGARRMSTEKGDLPDAVAKIYLAEPAKFGGSIAYYAGADAPKPAFRDHGSHLATHETNPNTIRDMVAIAAHRGWTTLDVRGADDFRREVWMEAKARGLDVRGYRSTQRDHQALEQRLEAQANRSIAPAPIERTPAINGANGVEAPTRAAPSRLDYDRGVEGKLVASGQAPYRNKAGEEPTPYIRIEREGGKPLDIWGVTLPEALAKSGAEIGDQVLVRRDGVERVEKTIRRQDEQSGQWTSERREVSRNRWSIEAERFRQSTPAEAARDPDLRNAQSHLAVVETMARAKLKDPASQARVVNRAKERIAEHLADGRQFRPARVQESQKVAEQSGRGRRQTAEAEVAGPERTRQR